MNAVRLGRQLRALRLRRRWRQADVAVRVGVSRASISNVERGDIARRPIEMLDRMATVLGGDLDVRLRWRGEQLDRLLDEEHARLTDAFISLLSRRGWQATPEATFAIYADRGSIDILAFHAPASIVLVVEMKTVIVDVQAMLSSIDRKARLGAEVARRRGWRSETTAKLLVVAEGSTNRDRVARLDASLLAAFPDRGRTVREWLRHPDRPIAGLLFFRSATGSRTPTRMTGVQRIHRR